MRRSIAAYLADIIDACDHILSATAGLTADGYLANKTIRRAVERDFQIIGGGLIQLRDREPDVFATIGDATDIIGFRNILVHQYFDLDHRTVWDTIEHDVQPLLKRTQQILDDLGEPLNE
ncbi:MAG: HepT-like ribonuclease domain-containing protein [Planctomycetota bacterium]